MKALVLSFVLALATLTGSSSSFAADERNVNVVNGTGYDIKFLGFNNPGDNEWSDNELGDVMEDGSKIYVKFNEADKGCVWNIRISWAEEGYPDVLWRNINLCNINTLTLKYNRSSDQTSFTAQ